MRLCRCLPADRSGKTALALAPGPPTSRRKRTKRAPQRSQRPQRELLGCVLCGVVLCVARIRPREGPSSGVAMHRGRLAQYRANWPWIELVVHPALWDSPGPVQTSTVRRITRRRVSQPDSPGGLYRPGGPASRETAFAGSSVVCRILISGTCICPLTLRLSRPFIGLDGWGGSAR